MKKKILILSFATGVLFLLGVHKKLRKDKNIYLNVEE